MLYVLGPYRGISGHKIDSSIWMPDLFGETYVSETRVVFVEVCARFDLSSEETSTERSIGNYCNPRSLAVAMTKEMKEFTLG